MSKIYEIFIFTASISEYANPVIVPISKRVVAITQVDDYKSNCSLARKTVTQFIVKYKDGTTVGTGPQT